MTEKEKMEKGLWYDANFDPELIETRFKAADLVYQYNATKPSDFDKKNEILKELLGYEVPEGLTIIQPFTCDYGNRIYLGKGDFINATCYFMDGGTITLGDHVFVGPYCGFYTANHPLNYTDRNKGLEVALPIKVGDNCWFGANVSVMPGVTIGSGCVIAAGCVVTKDIPDNSMVAGVPGKVIRTINQEERVSNE